MCFWMWRWGLDLARNVQSSCTLKTPVTCLSCIHKYIKYMHPHRYIHGMHSAWVGPLQVRVHAVRPFPHDVLLSVPLRASAQVSLLTCVERQSVQVQVYPSSYFCPHRHTHIHMPASPSLQFWDWTAIGISSLFLALTASLCCSPVLHVVVRRLASVPCSEIFRDPLLTLRLSQSLEGSVQVHQAWPASLWFFSDTPSSPPTADVFSVMWNMPLILTAQNFRTFSLGASVTLVLHQCSAQGLPLSQQNLESSILKHRFYYYSGATNQETTVIEKTVCSTHSSQEDRSQHGTWGSTTSVRRQREWGKHGREPLLWFSWERMGKAG